MPGLKDLYCEIILDHYQSPQNHGELAVLPVVKEKGFNPLCGDEMVVYFNVDDARVVADVKIVGQGCSISQLSASMMSAGVKAHTIKEVRDLIQAFKQMMSIHESGLEGDGDDTAINDLELGDLVALCKFPVRIKCATLMWNTLNLVLQRAIGGS